MTAFNIAAISEWDVPCIRFDYQGQEVTRPITDHAPIIQRTLWGAFGTINILNPGSPVAPPMAVNDILRLPKQGKQQMEAMAEYIFKMFQSGVVFLALQEVPPPDSENHDYLVNKLKELAEKNPIIDVHALTSQWIKTGRHAFGTSILYNPDRFTIHKSAEPVLDQRAAEYLLKDRITQTEIPVANIHGDYNNPQKTYDYVVQFSGIVLGDTNLHNMDELDSPHVLKSAEKSGVLVEGERRFLSTFDVIYDAFSRQIQPDFIPDTSKLELPQITHAEREEATKQIKSSEQGTMPEIKKNREKQKLFFIKLSELEQQINSLEKRRKKVKLNGKSYRKLNDAVEAATQVHQSLYTLADKYFENKISYTQFKQQSEEAIAATTDVLKTQRGFKRVWEVLMNIALIIVSLARSAWNGKMTFFSLNTKSMNIIDGIQEQINQSTPDP